MAGIGVNICTFIGRVGTEPELRYTPSGAAVVSLRLGVPRGFAGDGKEEETDWFSIIAWKERAEYIANHVNKGELVFVTGRMQIRKWKTQQGEDRQQVELVANDFKRLEPKGSGGQAGSVGTPRGGGQPQQQQATPTTSTGDDTPEYDPFAEE